jgi:O-antigen/teichoic acid export membrane protein
VNLKAKAVIKNLYYTVAANFATLAISILLNLFVPKLLGVKEYSYWQLYVFYSSYVGFLHFGWVDGIYLKIGGSEYEDLDKKSLGSQFWYLMIMEVIISSFVIIGSIIAGSSSNKSLILILTAVVSVVTIAKTFILYVLQSTNRIKEYAQLSRGDRYLYVFFIAAYFLIGGRNFYWLIILDILSKLIITVWGVSRISDMIFTKSFNRIKYEISNILENISIGIKLMLSSIAGMLIIGSIRFFVEKKWTIETFGKLSFTLSISNMFMTFINAVGVVMFPLLRRTNQNKLPHLYIVLRSLFVPLTYSFLLFYIPCKIILGIWLPEYNESLIYMGILFPMVIYEGRMSLLLNTYLKALRKEKTILIVNVLTLTLTLLLSLFVVFYVGNLYLTVGLIIFSLALRCVLAETFLNRFLNVKLFVSQLLETILTIVFILSNLFFSDWESFFVYFVAFIIYILINKRSVMRSFSDFRNLLAS